METTQSAGQMNTNARSTTDRYTHAHTHDVKQASAYCVYNLDGDHHNRGVVRCLGEWLTGVS